MNRVVVINKKVEQPRVVVAKKLLRGQAGLNGSITDNKKREAFTPTDGQLSFNLPDTVKDPHLSALFVNGQKVSYGAAYNFDSSFSILLWISSDYNLDPKDDFEFYYFI